MKIAFSAFLCLFLFSQSVISQIEVHENNNVFIGPLSSTAPGVRLYVDGRANFNCSPANFGGFLVDTLSYLDSVWDVSCACSVYTT